MFSERKTIVMKLSSFTCGSERLIEHGADKSCRATWSSRDTRRIIRLNFCRPQTEKTLWNARTAALSIEILARARRKLNHLSNMLVAVLCVVIILAPFAALLLFDFNLTLGG